MKNNDEMCCDIFTAPKYEMRETKHEAMLFCLSNFNDIFTWLMDDFIGIIYSEGIEFDSAGEITITQALPSSKDNIFNSIYLLIRGKSCDKPIRCKLGKWVIKDPDFGYVVTDDDGMIKRYKIPNREDANGQS